MDEIVKRELYVDLRRGVGPFVGIDCDAAGERLASLKDGVASGQYPAYQLPRPVFVGTGVELSRGHRRRSLVVGNVYGGEMTRDTRVGGNAAQGHLAAS